MTGWEYSRLSLFVKTFFAVKKFESRLRVYFHSCCYYCARALYTILQKLFTLRFFSKNNIKFWRKSRVKILQKNLLFVKKVISDDSMKRVRDTSLERRVCSPSAVFSALYVRRQGRRRTKLRKMGSFFRRNATKAYLFKE